MITFAFFYLFSEVWGTTWECSTCLQVWWRCGV